MESTDCHDRGEKFSTLTFETVNLYINLIKSEGDIMGLLLPQQREAIFLCF